MRPFLICGYPRSRTAWCASFFECEHEPSINWATLEEAYEFYRNGGQCADSMQTLLAVTLLGFRDLRGFRVLWIQRPREEVEASARKQGWPDIGKTLDLMDETTRWLYGDRVWPVQYRHLDASMRSINFWLTGVPWRDRKARFRELRNRNIQVSLEAAKAKCDAAGHRYMGLYRDAL